jgi:hypothetical protein
MNGKQERVISVINSHKQYFCSLLFILGYSCWFLLTLVDSCWFLLIVVDSCWFLLILVDSCWFLLILVDSCWFLVILGHSWSFLAILGHFSLNYYRSLPFMFVFNENEWNISFITVYYHSVLVISFIFYTNGSFLKEQEEIECNGSIQVWYLCSSLREGFPLHPQNCEKTH